MSAKTCLDEGFKCSTKTSSLGRTLLARSLMKSLINEPTKSLSLSSRRRLKGSSQVNPSTKTDGSSAMSPRRRMKTTKITVDEESKPRRLTLRGLP
ncbi:hypothetical protein Hdeb2414_s0007g00230771 [Helianthus debilis subsp. tardiflorus]